MHLADPSSEPARSDPGWREIESDHAELAACAERVERLLAGTAAGTGGDALRTVEALEALSEFHVRLLDHLATEESCRTLEQAAAVQPRLDRRVGLLRAEHAELRARSHAMVASAADAGRAFLYDRFVAFRQTLRAHERAENDVIHRAYCEDLGGRG